MNTSALRLGSLVGLLSALVSPSLSTAQICEQKFGRQFPAGDIDGVVEDLAVLDTPNGPEIYVAGGFAVAGGIQIFTVAKWTSKGFEPIEGTQIFGSVNDIEFLDEDGPGPKEPVLYIAGSFSIQGQPGDNVARWDGNDWETIGFFNGAVEKITMFDDGSGPALHACGDFSLAGGLFGYRQVTPIVKWDGQEWVPLLPAPSGMIGEARDMVVHDDGSGSALFVAGNFYERLPTHVGSGVKKWTGSAWVDLDVGLDGMGWSLATYDDGSGEALYVGGNFSTAGGAPANNVAKWDGTSWSAIAEGPDGPAYALSVDTENSTLIVGGQFTTVDGMESRSIAAWNGTSWTPYADGPDGAVFAIAALEENGDSVIYAGGRISSPGQNISRMANGAWKPLGNSVDGKVFEIVTIDTPQGQKLVVGGEFLSVGAGTVPASKIAMWDGEWSALGKGFDDSVFAIAQFDAGNGSEVIAGGQFRVATTLSADNVASWNGADWSAMGEGVTGEVLTAAVFDDGTGPALYIGGDFTVLADPSIRNLARWTGARWVPVGASPGFRVWNLLVHDDGSGSALFVVGSFQSVDEVAGTHGIARWDGQQWTSVGGGFDQPALGMAVYNDGSGPVLFVGGVMTEAGGVAVNGMARWNGSTWSDVAGGVAGGVVRALTVHNDGSGLALFIVGRFTSAGGIPVVRVAKFDGTSWSDVGGGVGGSSDKIHAIEVVDFGTGEQLVVGGEFAGAGPGGVVNVRNIAVWNGTTWQSAGFDRSNIVFDLEVFDAGNGPRLYAGYIRKGFGVGLDGGMASWDGATWTPTTIVGAANAPRVLALSSYTIGGNTELFIGGQFDEIGARTVNHIARWNGAEWFPIGSGADNSVKDLLVWNDGTGPALYVAGGFTQIGGQSIIGLAKWDGTHWSQLGTGIESGGRATHLAIHDDGSGPALFVAGKFEYAGGLLVDDLAKWDGSNWHQLDSRGFSNSDEIYTMVSFDDGSGPSLYVGGDFDRAGNTPASYLAKWDGTVWSQTGEPNHRVSAMGVFSDQNGSHLYASGPFTSIGGTQANHLARFDGVSWESLGSGFLGRTYTGGAITMASMEDAIGPALFMGGTFVRANGVSSEFLARWGCGSGDVLGCYPDCNQSTGAGVLDIFDFLCFQNNFVSGEPYACDCDTTTGKGSCDVFDFLCFQNAFVGGCP